MKKCFFIFTIFIFSFAAAPDSYAYDVEGIWMINDTYFISAHANGASMIGVTYFPGHGESFLMGNLSGNTVSINYSSDLSSFNATFIITSDTTGVITINSCIPYPGDWCLFPSGSSFSAEKVF